jgi:scyllo-inositol 2-dehydrogenase (NADP+)
MSLVRVGLIGFGMAGATFHAPLISAVPRLRIDAVATSRAEQVRGLAGEVSVVADAQRMAEDPDLDLIVIATPNRTHFPLARAALQAGKHVVVDKPLALDVGEADVLIALASERSRLLSVFHNRRWDGDFLTVRRLIDSRSLGEVMLYEARWDRFRPAIKQGWRELPVDGAGLLNDLGPHLIDQTLQLFGQPEAVSADIAIQRAEARVDDYFELTLHYGPMRAILSASTLVAAARPRFSVHGTEASFIKYGLDPQEAGLKAGASPSDRLFGHDDPASFGTVLDGVGRAEKVATEVGRYVSYYEAIASALLDGGPIPVKAADARDGLRIIELARLSAEQGSRLRFD